MGGHRGPCASCSGVEVFGLNSEVTPFTRITLAAGTELEGPEWIPGSQWEMLARTRGVNDRVGDGGWVGKKFRRLNQECLVNGWVWSQMKESTRSLRFLARATAFGAFLANPDITLDHLCSSGVIITEITKELSLK